MVIQLENITKTYDSGEVEVRALRGVSLGFEEQEFVAVMGASGSGKSTLMNILGCLDRPTSGKYLLDDEEVDSLSRADLANIRNQKLGFVFQGFNLIARTSALENVELPLLYRKEGLSAREIRQRSEEVLELVGLADRRHHAPNQLSGGQQQRVAIARALVNRPRVLLADEPTGNLDSRTSLEIMEVFQTLNDRGITMLMVTHEPDICQFAKRTIVVRDGKIVEDNPVTDRILASEQAREIHAETET